MTTELRTMSLLERCRRDRDHLLGECRRRLGAPPDLVPADWLEDVISEIVDYDLVQRALAEGLMAECDLDRREIALTTRLAACVRPNTDLVGLRNSTLAHELGHIRLHEDELRAVGCRNLPLEDPGYHRREDEANLYAATFLVPERMLWARPEMVRLLSLHASGQTLPSEELWELVLELSRAFRVTGSLIRRLLVSDVGLLLLEEPARELRVSSGPLVPGYAL